MACLSASNPTTSSDRAVAVSGESRNKDRVPPGPLWSTSATVIAVLSIALLFQERMFEPRDRERFGDSFTLIGLALAMVWGEGVSLLALAQNKTPGFAARIVVGAGIEFPLLVLLVRMVYPRFDAFKETLSASMLRAL